MSRNKKDISSVKKINKLGLCVLILSTIICILAISYAIWAKTYKGKKINSIETATLILTLDESLDDAISLVNAIPVSDTKGLTYNAYTFKLRNSGTIGATYRLMIVNDTNTYQKDGCINNKLDWSNIRYSFQKNNEVSIKGNLSDTAGILDLSEIEPSQINSYSLKLWIKSSATNEIMNQHFHGVIKVEAIQKDQTLED